MCTRCIGYEFLLTESRDRCTLRLLELRRLETCLVLHGVERLDSRSGSCSMCSVFFCDIEFGQKLNPKTT